MARPRSPKALNKQQRIALQRIAWEDQFHARVAEEMGRLAEKLRKEGQHGKEG